MKIVLAQLNFTVGDIRHNTKKIIESAQHARDVLNADMIVFPELALCGYSPEDLLLRDDFLLSANKALQEIAKAVPEILMVVGYPEKNFNSAAVFLHGKKIAYYRKQQLPNYGVFDEKRYFKEGGETCVFEYKNKKFGLLICEDLWFQGPASVAKKAGAEYIISINASPYDVEKIAAREKMLCQRHEEISLPIFYVHNVGAQDDLVFDGSSCVVNQQGKISARAPFAQESLFVVDVETQQGELNQIPAREAQMYQALVLGVRDYVHKNGFQKVLLGLSGGIDSALTLAIAMDALGKENVTAVALPSRYTSALSMQALEEQIKLTQVGHQIIDIEKVFSAFLATLHLPLDKPPHNLTVQNLQARARGMILMALSNDSNALLLNTSNKSEMAVGYGTLYGDMAGSYAVLKDVWKTEVYQLAHYRNQLSQVIPTIIIERAPSAELLPDQKDEDHLPPYSLLDVILQYYVEQDLSAEEIIAKKFDEKIVKHVIELVNKNEYKRRQSAPGPKVSARAFYRERRYPICFR